MKKKNKTVSAVYGQTFLESGTWTSFDPLKTSHPCVWTAPLHALSKVSLHLHTHLFFCLIWRASENLFCVPVLRRSCLFQENSATKRVSTMAYSRRYIMKSNWNTEKPSHDWFTFNNMHRFFSPVWQLLIMEALIGCDVLLPQYWFYFSYYWIVFKP